MVCLAITYEPIASDHNVAVGESITDRYRLKGIHTCISRDDPGWAPGRGVATIVSCCITVVGHDPIVRAISDEVKESVIIG